MLFTDAILSTVADLADYESEIQNMASTEVINLDTKLRLAQSELGIELLATSVLPDTNRVRNAFTLDQVVVTDALKLWHVFHTLSIVFRDAYNRKLNDKYLPKWNEYRDLAKTTAGQYLTIGVALVLQPLPAPGEPTLTGVAGGSLPATNYFARTTWVNSAGQESGPSQAVATVLPDGQLLVIETPAPPSQAVGWYPYLSSVSGQEQRQAGAPLDLSASWTMPVDGSVSGPSLPSGQPPDMIRTVPRTLQRG